MIMLDRFTLVPQSHPSMSRS